MKYLFLILAIIFLFSCQNKVEPRREAIDTNKNFLNNFDPLTKDLNEIYQQGLINGFSVAIVDQTETVYQMGFGYADRKAEKRFSEHTIQNVASISKTLIGIGLLKAQEMGKLDLDDPINMYLPFAVINPHRPKDVITLRHLATHTSTIKDTEYYGGKAYVLKDELDDSKEKVELYVKFNSPETHIPMKDMMIKVLTPEGQWYKREGFLDNKPGEVFEYSNIGATLAAVALAEATGEAFDDFTTKHILNPLGMSSSGWSFNKIDLSQHTKLYLNQEIQIPFYSLITYPDGGLITSANDLSKYLTELIKGYFGTGALLSPESYKELFESQLANEEHNEGIFMSLPSSGFIGHSGGDPGVSTHMFFDPKSKTGRILLVNTELDSVGNAILDKILLTLTKFERDI